LKADPSGAPARVVELTLELELDCALIAGRVQGPGVSVVPFVGWSGLSVALEGALRRQKAVARSPLDGPAAIKQLTPAEREVVNLVCLGLTNPQIADRLFISRRTVQGHLARIFRKVKVTSRTELAALVLHSASSQETEMGPDGPKDTSTSPQTLRPTHRR